MQSAGATGGRWHGTLALLAAVFLLGYAPCSAVQDGMARKLLGDEVTAAVIGGKPAPRGRYGWMASLRTNNPWPGFYDNFHFCGGTLIHPSVVMTAAHCMVDPDTGLPQPDFYYLPSVRLGGFHKLDDKPEDYELRQVQKTVTHPRYLFKNIADKSNNDIALLLLKTPSTKTPLALPPYTPKPGLPAAAGTRASVIGWGATYPYGTEGGKPPEYRLQQLGAKLMSIQQCQAAYGFILSSAETILLLNFSTNTMICAGNYPTFGNGVCVGDSGGPLFLPGASAAKDVQLGITSWVSGNCAKGPAVFTDVAPLRPWIDQTIAMLTAPDDWTGRVYSKPVVVGFDQGRFATTQRPGGTLKILVSTQYQLSAMLARGPAKGIAVMSSITLQQQDTVVAVSVVDGRAKVAVNGQTLHAGVSLQIQGGSVRYRKPLSGGMSRQITITQPGMAIRISQPFHETMRQYLAWLDVWVTLTQAPTTRLLGVLGRTFPKGGPPALPAGGNLTALVVSSIEEELWLA